MRAERIEEAAGALLAASSRIEAETMCVVPRRLVDALRAALALPADAPARDPNTGMTLDEAIAALFDARTRLATLQNEIDLAKTRTQPAPEGAGEAVAWAVITDGSGAVQFVCSKRHDAERERAGYAHPNHHSIVPLYARPTPRAEAASAEAVREACADRVRDEAGAWRSQVQRRLESDKATWADVVQARHYAEACEWVESAIRSLPLPAAPASAEAVAREAAIEAMRLLLDQTTSVLLGRKDVVSNEAIIRRAVAHALRGGG